MSSKRAPSGPSLIPRRVWTLRNGSREAASGLRAVPGIGAEIVPTVDGELRRMRLLSGDEQAELSGAIADTRAMLEARVSVNLTPKLTPSRVGMTGTNVLHARGPTARKLVVVTVPHTEPAAVNRNASPIRISPRRPKISDIQGARFAVKG